MICSVSYANRSQTAPAAQPDFVRNHGRSGVGRWIRFGSAGILPLVLKRCADTIGSMLPISARFLTLTCFLLGIAAATAAQQPDGQIVFLPADAVLNGASKTNDLVAFKTGGDAASWTFKPTRWGTYDVEVGVEGEAGGGEFELEVAGKNLRFTKSQGRTSAGRVYIARAEPFTVALRASKISSETTFRGVTLVPAPEGGAIAQAGDAIRLAASNAITHSVMMRYEPATNKNCLGYWVNASDQAEWQLAVTTPGDYEIELWQGCGRGQGGSDVAVTVNDGSEVLKESNFVVEETGHFQIFVPRRLGRVHFARAANYTFWIKPRRKQAGAIMDVRQVVLTRVRGENEAIKPVVKSKRVVFLGDSITYAGEYVEFVDAYIRLNYPDSNVEIINLGLPSETVSGLSEPGHAGGSFPRPDLHERLQRVLEKTRPDLIFACYGMNDGIYYPFGEERFAKFRDGIERLRERAEAAHAKVIHLTPPVFDPLPLKGRTLPAGRDEYRSPYEGYNEVLDRYSAWLMEQRSRGWQVIDIHTALNRFLAAQRTKNAAFLLAGDGVHPNLQGHWLIARELLREFGTSGEIVEADSPARSLESHPHASEVLKLVQQRDRLLKDSWLTDVGHLRPGMNKGKSISEAQSEAAMIEQKIKVLTRPGADFPGKRSLWYGFDRFDFEVDGRPVLVVAPRNEAPGRPWVWHGEFFGHKPNPDLALLGRGFHIVYMSVPDLLGSPEAVAHWNAFYEALTTRFGFAPKAALVGLSRGGLYCYNWAAANPRKTACIYGDAPVCDFKSWPGGFGQGKRSDRDWELVLKCYGFKSDEEAKAYGQNPVDNLAPLAAAKVPLLHVFGDADEIVPWQENTGLLAERYKELGGDITLIRKTGVNHHPHGLDDSTPIVEFIWEQSANSEAKAWLAAHGGGPIDRTARPLIRKLGTVDLDLVETTPVVLSNRLWRFEWVRQGIGQQYWDNQLHTNYFRFRDPASGETTVPFAEGHEFGSAFVHDGVVYVTGTQGRGRVNMFASRDLRTWETWPVIEEGRYGIFNTSLCRAQDDFVLMFEIDKPAEEAGTPFTARFARSADLRTWTLTPAECNYSKNRYTAPHALRWLEGWFYNFYLEAYNGYEMRVVRSRDLVRWESSPLNPVLRHDPFDKVIANPALTDPQRTRIANALNLNNSDIDFCEYQGRLAITYSWGNQQGVEHLASAVYDGSLRQFLGGWFPK